MNTHKRSLILLLLTCALAACSSQAPLLAEEDVTQTTEEPITTTTTAASSTPKPPTSLPTNTAVPTPEQTPTTAAVAETNFQCPLTPPSAAPPTDTDVFGDGPGAEWLCSPDNELCAVKAGPWPAGGWKVGWRKPSGSTLEIQGRRLDTEAPPLGAGPPGGYTGTFQASGLNFPMEGCWEVEARAAESTVRFVVEVGFAAHSPRGGSCDTLAEAVENSDGIIIGLITESKPGPDGRYIWHDVAVRGVAKNPYGSGGFTAINLLQDTQLAPALEENHPYLLFVQRDPFQLFCPERTLAEVQTDGQVVGLSEAAQTNPLWSAASLTGIRGEIQSLLLASEGSAASP